MFANFYQKSVLYLCQRNAIHRCYLIDKTIYTFRGILFPGSDVPYHYRTDDPTIEIGDKVVVPVGWNEIERVVEVVSVEKHTRLTVPYPVNQVKFNKRKYQE